MEHVLLDRSSGSFEYRPQRNFYGGGARPARPHGGAYGSSRTCPQYHHFQQGGAWRSAPAPAPAVPYVRPVIYSSPSLPLPPSNQPPLLPLPPTATKYAAFPYAPQRAARPAPPPTTVVPAPPAAAAPAPSRQMMGQSDRRRRPAKPPATEPSRVQKKKKPLERATPLPAAAAVAEALDDLEQEVARSFVQDLLQLHALAPPPSSLPLPRFSLVTKASSSSVKVALPAAPSCNAEAASADGLRRLLRL